MLNKKSKKSKREQNYFKQQKSNIMNTTKKITQLFFILALISGGLWNLNSCKDDNSDILEKIDQVDKSLSDKIEALSKTMGDITKALQGLTTKVDGLATKEDVAAVKDVVDKLTTALSGVASTVSGLKDAVSADVKAQLATQLTAIKTAMDALQTALEQKIATATAGTTKGDYQALLDQLKALKAELDAVKADLEGADGIIEKLKALQKALTGTGGIKEQLTTLKTTVDGLVTSLAALSKESAKQKDLQAIKTLVEQIIETLKTLATKADTPTKKEIQDMEARLKKALDDFEKAQTETEKEHYDEIMKTLKAQNTYVIDDAVFADFLRADDGINKAFIFTNEDLDNKALLKAEGLTREEAKRYINKVHRDVISRKSLDISAYSNKANIRYLRAIKIFTALETLNAKGLTSLQELKFSNANYQLTDLNVSGDTALDDNSDLLVDKCTALKKLDASKTNIKGLNLSANSALEDLNLNGCSNLQSLDASNNNVLAVIDVIGCSSMTTLNVNKTVLTTLDISGDTFEKLQTVKASNCSRLTTLKANRPDLYHGSIVSLNVSDDYSLTTLTANYNGSLNSLKLTNDKALVTLEANFADLSTGLTLTDLGSNNKLTTLKVSNTSLSTLDISANHNLVTCIAHRDEKPGKGLIGSIVLPGGTSFHTSSKELLETLDVSNNKLTFINLTNLAKLKQLNASYNLITGDTPLKDKELSTLIAAAHGLDTHINKDLVRLNVSGNVGLLSLRLYNNGNLNFLNIKSTKVATDSANKLDLSMLEHFKTSGDGSGTLLEDNKQLEIDYN